MQAAPSPAPPSGPPPSSPPVVTAWPRSAQLTLVFLLGLATALVAVYAIGSFGGSRPTEHQDAPLSYRIDLNKASHAELLQLPGVGEKTAQRIEDQRHAPSDFRQTDDLARVPNTGREQAKKLAQLGRILNSETPEDSAFADLEEEGTLPGSRRTSSGKKATVDKSSKLAAGLIDLNRASAGELYLVPGIGPTVAERILDERARGPFKSVDDLRRVHGIGAKTLERLRPYLKVSEDAPAKAATSRSPSGAE
jgi:competence protein ComEA